MNTETKPDFEALRAKRNADFESWVERMRAKGWDSAGLCAINRKDACYCACTNGGPCEHDWTGPGVDLGEGAWSVTCARCGLDAMGHSLRTDP